MSKPVGTTPAQREQIMEEFRSHMALANAQLLVQKMTDKCFKKCINKPGTSLDNSERGCLAKCMDRYMDSWNQVMQAYAARIQRESQQNH